jgi:hypothetical protein
VEPIVELIVLLIKLVIYVAYFLPVLGARVLEALGVWPEWWPFGGVL